jgi:two-component system OmpR family response regulator
MTLRRMRGDCGRCGEDFGSAPLAFCYAAGHRPAQPDFVVWTAHVPDTPLQERTPMPGQSAGLHILVCDDESSLREMFQEALEDEGYRVTVLPRVCEDLAEVMRLEPDLVILDVLFAGKPKGSEFLQRLKAHPATTAIPVLVCSAADALVDAQVAAWQCGSIAKPFDLEELLAAVRACLYTCNPGA